MGRRKGFITRTSNKTSVDLEVKSPATLRGQTTSVITIRLQNPRSLKKENSYMLKTILWKSSRPGTL